MEIEKDTILQVPYNKTTKMSLNIHLSQCNKCGRKVILQNVLIGTNHTIAITCVCAECMLVDKTFAKNNPEIAQKIEDYCKI